jgi:hypothetical protein
MKGAAKVKRKRYKKQILDKISNLSPEESKEFWKILRWVCYRFGYYIIIGAFS